VDSKLHKAGNETLVQEMKQDDSKEVSHAALCFHPYTGNMK